MGEHNHGVGVIEARANRRRLLVVLAITLVITVAEIMGGIVSNSLALLSDAGHMFTDTLALGLSLFAVIVAARRPTSTRTYGYYRAEIMAALINGAVLLVVAGVIIFEAYQRLFQPEPIQGGLMLGIAVVGLLANIAGVAVLRGSSRENLNIKGAFWHMLTDALSSVGVIAAAIIISVTGWLIADPIMSIIISILIIRGALSLVVESSNILLEAVPKHINVGQIVREAKQLAGVKDLHDVHVWTITSGVYALSAHIQTDDRMLGQCASIIDATNGMLLEKFGIEHTTLQLECAACMEGKVCSLVRSE